MSLSCIAIREVKSKVVEFSLLDMFAEVECVAAPSCRLSIRRDIMVTDTLSSYRYNTCKILLAEAYLLANVERTPLSNG